MFDLGTASDGTILTNLETVAGQAYIIQGFMSRFPNLPVIGEPTGTAREAIADYIRSLGKVSPPSDRRLLRVKS